MRIAILVPNFVGADGGARVAEIQAEELAEMGNYVAVFTFAAEMKPKGVEVFVMGMPKSLFWERIYRLFFPLDLPKTLKWLPRLKSFDLIIVHLYPLTWLSYLAKTVYKVRYTFWFHGMEDPKLFPHLHERVYMRLQIFLTRWTVRNVDRAVSVSKFAQTKLKEYTGLDSEVVYNKVDDTKFQKGIDGSEIRRRYKLGDAPVILNVGRIVPQKGAHLLIQAFHQVNEEFPQATLMIVGDFAFDYYTKKLKEMSGSSVIFVGHVSHDEMPYYYAACDIYATCSSWETFNLPVVEAQSCGKPVVTFDNTAFKETVGENGILVETGNIERFSRACIDKLAQVRRM